jgi:hypothetical protein
MKVNSVLVNIVAIVLVLGGIYMGTESIQGWGWLVFLGAVICAPSVVKESKK